MALKQVKFSLRLGCLSDSLEEQLNKQGLTLGEGAERAQDKADAISNLYVAGILTEAETTRARKRFCRLLAKAIERLEEENNG